MAIYGYACFAAYDKNKEKKLSALNNVVLDESDVYFDEVSSLKDDRPHFKELSCKLQKGDLLYIASIDFYATNFSTWKEDWNHFTKTLGADVIVLDAIDLFNSIRFRELANVGYPIEDKIFATLSYTLNCKQKLIKDMQMEGINRAKEEGVHMGRPRIEVDMAEFERCYLAIQDGSMSIQECLKELNIKRSKFYSLLHEYNSTFHKSNRIKGEKGALQLV